MLFFFTLYENGAIVEAHEAHEARDLEDALNIAIDASRDIISSDVRSGYLPLSGLIVVEDERRREVGRILFRDVLEMN